MLLFNLFGIEFDFEPLTNELKNWWAQGLKMLPNLLIATVVILLGWMLTNFLKRYFDRLSRKLVKNPKIADLLSSTFTILLVIGIGLLVLSILNLSDAVDKIFGAAGVVGLALGLAFQDPILNFFSGILLTIRDLFSVGDLIEVDGHFGKVKQITLRHTAIETLQGQDIMIPNKIVAQNALTNYNKLGKRRVDLSCGVSYGDDLSQVHEVTVKAIKDNVPYDTSKDVQLFFTDFGDSSVNYTLRFWLDQRKTGQADFLSARSQAIMAIMTAYNENDIMIPFPIRTLDFGIKGGEKLSEMAINLQQSKNKNSDGAAKKNNGTTEHA